MLIALAFGLHRPGRWGAALFVAALALALRELVLPFVLLMAAMAAWRKDWREATAWIMLVAVAVLFSVSYWLVSKIDNKEIFNSLISISFIILKSVYVTTVLIYEDIFI